MNRNTDKIFIWNKVQNTLYTSRHGGVGVLKFNQTYVLTPLKFSTNNVKKHTKIRILGSQNTCLALIELSVKAVDPEISNQHNDRKEGKASTIENVEKFTHKAMSVKIRTNFRKLMKRQTLRNLQYGWFGQEQYGMRERMVIVAQEGEQTRDLAFEEKRDQTLLIMKKDVLVTFDLSRTDRWRCSIKVWRPKWRQNHLKIKNYPHEISSCLNGDTNCQHDTQRVRLELEN